MKPTVIIKVPGPSGIAVIHGIPAVRWRREDRNDTQNNDASVYIFESADGNKAAEFPVDVVLAISFDGAEEETDATANASATGPYSAFDLLNALVDWYDEEFGPDPEDVAGALVAVVPLYFAAGAVLNLDKEDARDWVRDELRRIHAIKNP